MTPPQEPQSPLGKTPRNTGARKLLIPVLLYVALTLPYGFTKLNGDEVHFVTIPYLMVGGDYFLSALHDGDYGSAIEVAATSYALAWRYFVRPSDATETSAAALEKFPLTRRASGREKPFVFTADYFITHRKGGRPLVSFLLNLPALGVTYFLPRDLYSYQRDFIYHPAFLAPRLSVWLLGLLGLWLVFRIVSERVGAEAGFRAALLYAVLPITAVWSTDLHQDVPMAVLLIPFFYFAWKRKYLWAGVFWGLAFATKNQAIFALAPVAAEGIWNAFGSGSERDRRAALFESFKALGVIFLVGFLVSAPFGHPVANLQEVWDSSSADIPKLYGVSHLYYRMPIWMGVAMLAILGLKLLQDARDSFDRMHTFFLIVPALLYFIHDYRSYMFVPSAAILVATYFERRTLYFLAVALLAINLVGLRSPYLTSRHLMYDWLNEPGAPRTIEEIERIPGMGGVGAEEDKTPAPRPGDNKEN